MWIGLLLLIIFKGFLGFFALIQVVRLSISPGFAEMMNQGKRLKKNVLLNNLLFLIGCCVLFYILGLLGINILGNK